MNSPTTVKTAWDTFRERCLPLAASAGQVEDMRCAFYAGSGVMFAMITSVEPDEPDADVIARLEGFSDEFEVHALVLKERGK